IDNLGHRFGLTRAEAILALEICKGDGREAAAQRCGISVSTAHTHLNRIFSKTGTRRQAELVHLLLTSHCRAQVDPQSGNLVFSAHARRSDRASTSASTKVVPLPLLPIARASNREGYGPYARRFPRCSKLHS